MLMCPFPVSRSPAEQVLLRGLNDLTSKSVRSGDTRGFRNRHGLIRYNGVSEPIVVNLLKRIVSFLCAAGAVIIESSRLTKSASNSAA